MEAVLLSGRERKRLVVMAQVRSGKMRLRAAAEHLGVSYRQVMRLWGRFAPLRSLALPALRQPPPH